MHVDMVYTVRHVPAATMRALQQQRVQDDVFCTFERRVYRSAAPEKLHV